MIECMFERSDPDPAPEVIAAIDEVAEGIVLRTPTAESAGWVERVSAAVRAHAAAALR